MMIDANKKMTVVYMKENPVQHKGKTGREINFEDSKLFTEPEIEKMNLLMRQLRSCLKHVIICIVLMK